MNYQDDLTSKRRAALWRALRPSDEPDVSQLTPWDASRHQGKREDQVEFSLLVIAVAFTLGALVGVAGLITALWEAWR
jgi:hypothetical protein